MVTSKSLENDYCVKVSNGNVDIISDVTEDKGGSGEYIRPHELLCSAFASCLNMTTRMVMDRSNIKYDDVIIKVDLDRSNPEKTKFLYNIDIKGNISDRVKNKIINVAKNCPVRKTLSKEIEFEEF